MLKERVSVPLVVKESTLLEEFVRTALLDTCKLQNIKYSITRPVKLFTNIRSCYSVSYVNINRNFSSQFNDTFRYISGGSREDQNCNLYTQIRDHKQFIFLGPNSWNILPHPLERYHFYM